MKFHFALRPTAMLMLVPLSLLRLTGADGAPIWQAAETAGISVVAQPDGSSQIVSANGGDFTVESAASLPAKRGDCFALNLRLKVGLDMRALPELVCFDAQGREIPIPSSLLRSNPFVTTNWQSFERVFACQPNTASVRARVRARGRGTILLEGLRFQATQIDTYQTGALVSQPHPKMRNDIVLESNFGIVNPELVSNADRDDDGKWALITINLDELTAPPKRGEDWRSNFEDNPNVILWTDGAVLKSDSVYLERAPDRARALHYRTKVHPGPYVARVSDPGRPVAVSLDGRTWRRSEPGEEIALGPLAAPDGIIEFWIDACHVDAIKPGPAYFDYVRLTPTIYAPDIDRLFAAARAKPAQLTHGAADETKVPVIVAAPPFAGGVNWPVRCGLPVPRGELVSADHVAVLNAAGVKIPGQNRVTATWPDGSIKWLFLDFMSDLSAGRRVQYMVVYGNRVTSLASKSAVQVQRRANGLEVDTGAIRFLVSSAHFGIVENVRLASGRQVQREPISAEIVEAGGRIWRALDLPVAKIEVEQAGPLHTVILIETKLAESGKPSSGFYHRARIHAYAGSPLVEVDYFVANTDSRPAKNIGGSMASKVVVKTVALKVRPADAVVGTWFDSGRGTLAGARVQKAEELALEISGMETKETRTPVPGWIGMNLDNGGSLQVGVADFRAQFPKAFRWNPKELEIDLWPEEGGDYDWIEGVGKTHHLSLFYGEAAATDAALLASGPVLATATPEWYVHTGVFGVIGTAAESGQPAIENNLVAHMKNPVVGRIGLGFENYGDHSSNGYVKGSFLWDNNEYDLPAGCMVHFARTGDRAALQVGLASALHYVDVDTIHYSSAHADWARAHHVHSHGLLGHHTAQGPDFNHVGYVQGLIWYSYFMGDPDGLLGAQGIADWCLEHLSVHTHTMERAMGHPMMTLNDVYEATGDEKYLRGSAQLVDQALKWENPVRSGFLSPNTESPAYYSGSSFNNGLLSAALIKFNGWAHQPEIDALLERFARWTLTDAWKVPDGLASKAGSPRVSGSPQHIGNQGRLMAYVYARTHEPLYMVVPARLATAGFGANARPIGTRSTGLVFNYLPWLLAALREQGNPEPEPQLEVSAKSESLELARGATGRVGFTVKNNGREPIEDVRVSFQTRLDFAVAIHQALPTRLLPGQSAECWYEVRAPGQVNLSCDYNVIACGHWCALYRRADQAHLAYRSIKLGLK